MDRPLITLAERRRAPITAAGVGSGVGVLPEAGNGCDASPPLVTRPDSLMREMPLSVERIDSVGELRRLAAEWQALFTATGSDLPFATCEWVESWWNHLRHDGRSSRDHLQLRVLRSREGRLVALAPMILTERPAVGPARVRSLQFMGPDPNITELRGLLTLPEYEEAAYTALLEDLGKSSWDWIRWSGLRSGGEGTPVDECLSVRLRATPVLLLELAPTWEEFKAGLKRNIRESLRKCYNSLKREQHAFELRVAREPAEVEAAIGRFFPLHEARSAVTDAVPHPNVFRTPEARAFLKDVTDRLAVTGATRVFELVVDGEVVATRIGFQFSERLYLYYSGYNPAWGRFSVMTTTVAEAIKYAIEAGLRTVNLSTGVDVAKTRWGPTQVTYGEGIQIAGATRSHVAYQMYERALRFRNHRGVRLLTRSAAAR